MKLLYLFRGVVDKRAKLTPLTLGDEAVKQIVNLLANDARAVVENMLERLRLAVKVAQEMLRSLGEIEYRLEIYHRRARRLNRRILF